MNERKIAIITCVSDEQEYSESLYYISKLTIPNGFEIDTIAVREAPSMAAGYNAAMKSSDAKYKIYIHQDVFLIYKDMLKDMLEVFWSDENIGMLGVLGARLMPKNAHAISRWDTGRTLCNGMPNQYRGYESGMIMDVMAVDGMFMATQCDVEWREDLFHGWHFYDIAQSCEFLRRGMRVVIPSQRVFWMFHDNKASDMKEFDKYRTVFMEEYQDIYPFEQEECTFANRSEYEELKLKSLKLMQQLITDGKIAEVAEVMCLSENQGHLILKELELICKIYQFENIQEEELRIYQYGMSYGELYDRLMHLKHLLKRVEYTKEADICEEILNKYSCYAIIAVMAIYVIDISEVYGKLLAAYENCDTMKAEVFRSYEKIIQTNRENPHNTLYVKGQRDFVNTRKTLIILEDLDVELKNNTLNRYDKKEYTIFVERYMMESLNLVKEADVLCGNVVRLVAICQDRLYADYDKVIIYGEKLEEYVKLFCGTQIAVTWYVSGTYQENIAYSNNIVIKKGESV